MSYAPTNEESKIVGDRAQSLAIYRHLIGDRDSKIATVRSTIGPASDSWKRAEDDLTSCEAATRTVYAKLGRLTNGKLLSGWWFLFAAVLFAALEAPINKFMLDNILRGSNFDSYALSLFVTFSLLWLAHYAGHQIRQIYSDFSEKAFISKIIIGFLIICILFCCVGVLTIGRAFYSVAGIVASGKDIFSEVTKQIVSIGPWQSFVAALSDNSALFLACLNTAGLAIAFLAAFTRYDSDENYQSAMDAEQKAKRALAKIGRKYAKAVKAISRKYGPKLAAASASYGAQNARVVALKTNRGAVLSAEDQYDISKEDVLLTQARNELDQSAHLDGNKEPANDDLPASVDDEAQKVAVMGRDRR